MTNATNTKINLSYSFSSPVNVLQNMNELLWHKILTNAGSLQGIVGECSVAASSATPRFARVQRALKAVQRTDCKYMIIEN